MARNEFCTASGRNCGWRNMDARERMCNDQREKERMFNMSWIGRPYPPPPAQFPNRSRGVDCVEANCNTDLNSITADSYNMRDYSVGPSTQQCLNVAASRYSGLID